jgi:hypothetical protein
MTTHEQYRIFCAEQKELPIFMQAWYLDAVCPEQWQVVLVEKAGKIVGAWPYHLKKKWFFQRVTMPVLLRQCGPFVAESWRGAEQYSTVIEELADQLPITAAFSQDLPYQATDLLPLHWKGFRLSQRFSYQLTDLFDQATLLKGIKASYRKDKIPKAEKHYELDAEVDIEVFLRLHSATYQRKGLKEPASQAYIRRLDQSLAQHKGRVIIGAKDKATQEIHAAAYLIYDEYTAYLLMSADDGAHRKEGSGIYAIWLAIQYTHQVLGLNTFDFCGSMVKKIASVRKQFGAQIKSYLRIERDGKLMRLYRALNS